MLDKAVGTVIVLAFWSGGICTVIGVTIARPLLVLLGSPPEMLDMAATYLTIYFGGVISLVYFNILSGVLRGMGDSVSPLLYLLFASVLNIALDILFVTQFGMKTDGVALATVIAQTLAALLAFRKLRRMTEVVDVRMSDLKLNRGIAGKIIKLGLPLGAMQMVGSLQAVLVQALVNSMGSLVVTTITAVMRVDGFIMMTNFSFATAATTFTAQNFGAKKLARIRKGHRDTLKIAHTASLFLVAGIVLFGRQLMELFTSTDAVAASGARFFRILAAGYVAFCGSADLCRRNERYEPDHHPDDHVHHRDHGDPPAAGVSHCVPYAVGCLAKRQSGCDFHQPSDRLGFQRDSNRPDLPLWQVA